MTSSVRTHGAFIVIDGADGAGKDTQIAKLREQFGDRSDVIFTRDPGGTQRAADIRDVLLADSSEQLCPDSELLLFLAARAQLVSELVRPARAAGYHIICQRFSAATYAYQIAGRQQSEATAKALAAMEAYLLADQHPDHTIILDVSVNTALARTRQRARQDQIESRGREYFQRVIESFRAQGRAGSATTLINAEQPIDDVYSDVYPHVAALVA
jgi:dTMP kinase